MNGKFCDKHKIRDLAHGQWLFILERLCPELGPAIARLGRHVPCPVHGGKDGFRLFKDAQQTGGGICNSCGAKADGPNTGPGKFPHSIPFDAISDSKLLIRRFSHKKIRRHLHYVIVFLLKA